MWLLRILLSIQENFGLWIMGILIAEGVFAFVTMFIFPPASIAMVFLGLLTLGLSIVAKALLGWSILLLCRILKVAPPTPPDSANTAPA